MNLQKRLFIRAFSTILSSIPNENQLVFSITCKTTGIFQTGNVFSHYNIPYARNNQNIRRLEVF